MPIVQESAEINRMHLRGLTGGNSRSPFTGQGSVVSELTENKTPQGSGLNDFLGNYCLTQKHTNFKLNVLSEQSPTNSPKDNHIIVIDAPSCNVSEMRYTNHRQQTTSPTNKSVQFNSKLSRKIVNDNNFSNMVTTHNRSKMTNMKQVKSDYIQKILEANKTKHSIRSSVPKSLTSSPQRNNNKKVNKSLNANISIIQCKDDTSSDNED